MTLKVRDSFEALKTPCDTAKFFCTTKHTYQKHFVGPEAQLVATNPRSGGKCIEHKVNKAGGNSYRCELILKKGDPCFDNDVNPGDEFWYAISMFPVSVPDDGTNEVLMQLHDSGMDAGEKPKFQGAGDSTPDPDGITKSPTMAIWCLNGEWRLSAKWDATKVSKSGTVKSQTFTPPAGHRKVDTGWTDWVFHIIHHYDDATGLWEAWKRSGGATSYTKVLTRKGGNMFNDDKGFYWQFGIYKSVWRKRSQDAGQNQGTQGSRVWRFDDLRIGDKNSSFNEITGGGPAPTPTVPPPVITEPSPLPSAQVDKAYDEPLSVNDGEPKITWTGTSVPTGLRLETDAADNRTGHLIGTPTTAATTDMSITATDNQNRANTKTLQITVHAATVTPPAPTITESSPLPGADQNVAYSKSIAVSDGKAPHVWTATPLPAGMSVSTNSTDNRTGILSGTPTATGTTSISFTVKDDLAREHQKFLSFTVSAPPAEVPGPTILEASPLPNATRDRAYSELISVKDGTGKLTWSGSPVPAGLKFSTHTDNRAGVLDGTPTQSGTTNIGVTSRTIRLVRARRR
jgi:Putative Ig domain.